jgi:hypothetical protein
MNVNGQERAQDYISEAESFDALAPWKTRWTIRIALACLLGAFVGFAMWLRLQLSLGDHFLAYQAGVPYQTINVRASELANRHATEWILSAVGCVLLSGLLIFLELRRSISKQRAMDVWRR